MEHSDATLEAFWRNLRDLTLSGLQHEVPAGPAGDALRELGRVAKQHHTVELLDEAGQPVAYVMSWDRWTARWPNGEPQ